MKNWNIKWQQLNQNFITILSLKCGVQGGHINGNKYCNQINYEIECKRWLSETPNNDMSVEDLYKVCLKRGENYPEGLVWTNVNLNDFKKVYLDSKNEFPIY